MTEKFSSPHLPLPMKNEANGPEVITFGCRLNSYEAEVMRHLGAQAHLDDVIIVNTCAVTNEAERQARQAIRKAHQASPHKRIVVTGCAAQLRPETFAQLPGVTHVLGNQEKTQETTYTHLNTMPEGTYVGDIMAATTLNTPAVVTHFEGMARAFVEIQNGCNHRCTFCTIPFGRGNNRSSPVAQVVAQVQKLVAQGYNEVVLTGVDITDYGQDLPGQPPLGDLVRRLFVHVPQLQRLRLSSLDPVEVDDDLYAIIAQEPRIMPHFHLSAQAGDALVLKRMRRRHTPEDLVVCVERLALLRPGATFGADIIAGFPTESDAMFQATFDLVQRLNFAFLHVFPFSPRPGTPAARMPLTPPQVVKYRAQRLRRLGEDLKTTYLTGCLQRPQKALVEKTNVARTDHYASVAFHAPHIPAGSLVTVLPTALDGKGGLVANVLDILREAG